MGLGGDLRGKRLRQQKHAQAEQQPQCPAGKPCRMVDPADFRPVFQSCRTGNRLCHGGR